MPWLNRTAALAVASACLLSLVAFTRTAAADSLEVYGRLPSLEDVALSPSGSRIAFVRTEGDVRAILVVSLADSTSIGGVRVGRAKLRSLEWADDDHLLIYTSVTSVLSGFTGPEQEWTELQVYDVASKKLEMVPDANKLHVFTRDRHVEILNVVAGFGTVRRVNGHTLLFVPVWTVSEGGGRALYRYDLQTKAADILARGTGAARWLVNGAGELAAEEIYQEQSQRWVVSVRQSGQLHELASGVEPVDYPYLLGFGPTPDTLLMHFVEAGNSVWRLMSLADGSMGPPMAEHRSLESPIEDPITRRMIGGVHVGDDSEWIFFDDAVQKRWTSVKATFSGARLRFVSASATFSTFVVRVDGPKYGFAYQLVDMAARKAQRIGDVYDGLPGVLETRRITYAASDGLDIPAYLTLPPGGAAKNLPLVVLPHGGPQARDTADFDWWSQGLAQQGYAVLRPNFRGSNLSQQFVEAGYGQWGRKMQTDLSDGVRFLAKEGLIDPARVCIVGASYGGYAALAGATLDLGVYRCVASISGVSDLTRMLANVDAKHLGRQNFEQRYWNRFMGVSGSQDPALDALSPIKHVEAVSIPVLLIHGRDDTVVPFEQSQAMFDALKRSKKDVELVTMPHEDHWLSRSETRLQMLRSVVAFLQAKNPPNASAGQQ